MQSTALIHAIVEKYGAEDKQGLMISLKALRKEVQHETLKPFRKAINDNFYE